MTLDDLELHQFEFSVNFSDVRLIWGLDEAPIDPIGTARH